MKMGSTFTKMGNRQTRRTILKITGGFVATVVIGGSLALSRSTCQRKPTTQNPRFDELWDLMLEYADIRNHQMVNGSSTSARKKAWKAVLVHQKIYFPEADFSSDLGRRLFMEKHGKFWGNIHSMTNPSQRAIVLGTIVDYDIGNLGLDDEFNESTGRFTFFWHGHNPDSMPRSNDYRIIAFRQEGDSIDNLRGKVGANAIFYSKDSTMYLNLTEIERTVKNLYYDGSDIDDVNLDDRINKFDSLPEKMQKKAFLDFMLREFYTQVMKEAIKRNPNLEVLRRRNSKETRKKVKQAWVDTAWDIIVLNSINHEKMHYYFGSKKHDGREVREEIETFYFQGQNDFNSHVFVITCDHYNTFYLSLEKSGYSRKKLMEMTPSQRANMFSELLDNMH
jgi:hypothetical protein